jgi:hypothetical protein
MFQRHVLRPSSQSVRAAAGSSKMLRNQPTASQPKTHIQMIALPNHKHKDQDNVAQDREIWGERGLIKL